MKFRERLIFQKMAVVVAITLFVCYLVYVIHDILFLWGVGDASSLIDSTIMPYQRESYIKWPSLTPYLKAQYPQYRPLLTVIQMWNPDVPDHPDQFVETLQHFNYSDPKERQLAEAYRNAEVPFKLYDIPDIEHVRRLWSREYLRRTLRFEFARVEKSKNNHFMFYTNKAYPPSGFQPPQEVVYSMSFSQWYDLAQKADEEKLGNTSTHYYYTLGSQPGDTSSSFIARDLPLFSTRVDNFFIPRVRDNKGIQCRFGMRGVIAESHYDSGRNMVAMIRGSKRYILTPPHTCRYLGIIKDTNHPSYRHSTIDWSDEAEARAHQFDQVDSIDTIVNSGEILYIPSFWFHYIISMQYSIQCNSRSGYPSDMKGEAEIRRRDCMGGA